MVYNFSWESKIRHRVQHTMCVVHDDKPKQTNGSTDRNKRMEALTTLQMLQNLADLESDTELEIDVVTLLLNSLHLILSTSPIHYGGDAVERVESLKTLVLVTVGFSDSWF